MTERQDKAKLAEIRQIRETQYAAAMDLLTSQLHEQFCDDDQLKGPWDEAVVLNVLNGFFDLPQGLHSGLVATLALDRSKRAR